MDSFEHEESPFRQTPSPPRMNGARVVPVQILSHGSPQPERKTFFHSNTLPADMRHSMMSRLSPMPDMDSFFNSTTLPDMAMFMNHRPSMQSRQSPLPEVFRQTMSGRQSPMPEVTRQNVQPPRHSPLPEVHRANIQVRQSPPPPAAERPTVSTQQQQNIEKQPEKQPEKVEKPQQSHIDRQFENMKYEKQPQPQPQPQHQSQPQQEPEQPRATTLPRQQSDRAQQFQAMRKTSIDDFNEQIVNMLDEVEKRVESFREAAAQLELEKEQILDMLSNVNVNTELLRLGEGEREDICATTHRLLSRTKTVDVQVNTPRNQEQAKALQSVHQLIDGVLNKLQEDLNNGKENNTVPNFEDSKNTARRYLNACSPDEPEGPIDQKFQAQVVECTADDQKKIRRKLAQIINQVERAERTCLPDYN